MQYRVLICDDNVAVHKSLTSYLRAEGIEVVSVYSGEEAVERAKESNFDIAILDIMLPGISGLDVCRQIRKRDENIYIIMLSAKAEEVDRIIGLEVGADSYVVKPFSPREMTIRIRKVLARLHQREPEDKLTFEELIVEPKAYKVSIMGEKTELTPKEIEVLAFLIKNEDRALSRTEILDSVWGYDYYGDTRIVDSLIKRLRKKIQREGIHYEISSIYGVGYKMERLER